jgi:cell wall-associated NlpC family hydrolase
MASLLMATMAMGSMTALTGTLLGQQKAQKTATVAKTDVIVRSGPGTSYDRVAKVDKGRSAEILESRNGWYKLKFSGGTTGWIRADMLSVAAPKAAAKPAAKPPAKPAIKPAEKPVVKPAEGLPETPEAQPTKIVISNVAEEKPVEKPIEKAPEPAKAAPLKIEIKGNDVNIRKEPNTKAARVVQVDKGRVADVLAKKDGWFKVKFQHGTIGWVHGDFVKPTSASAKDPVKPAPAKKTSTPKLSGAAASLIDTAKDQIGVRYRYGGTSRSGFDCSGFVQFVFAKHGVKLPRTSLSQSGVGAKVAKSDLIVGDLVFFVTRGSRVSHVGIYIGDGKFIHASSGGGRVRIDALSTSYYAKRYAGARRVGKFSSTFLDTAKAELGQKAVPEEEGPLPMTEPGG